MSEREEALRLAKEAGIDSDRLLDYFKMNSETLIRLIRLARQSAPQQEPFLWFNPSERPPNLSTSNKGNGWIPLYAAAPAASDVARDALRYRWLRDIGDGTWIPLSNAWLCNKAARVDEIIDAAMQQSAQGEKSDLDGKLGCWPIERLK